MTHNLFPSQIKAGDGELMEWEMRDVQLSEEDMEWYRARHCFAGAIPVPHPNPKPSKFISIFSIWG